MGLDTNFQNLVSSVGKKLEKKADCSYVEDSYLSKSKASADYLTKSDAAGIYTTDRKVDERCLSKSDAANTYERKTIYANLNINNDTYVSYDANSDYIIFAKTASNLIANTTIKKYIAAKSFDDTILEANKDYVVHINHGSVTSVSKKVIDGTYQYSKGGFTVTVGDNGKKASVVGSGVWPEGLRIVSTIESVNLDSRITTIGKWAFIGCTELKSVVIPKEVTLIDENAFAFCTSLSSVVFESGSKCISMLCSFVGCEGLTSITIPKSVKTLGNGYDDGGLNVGTFTGCSSLTSVTFEAGSVLEFLGRECFKDCVELVSIQFPDSRIVAGHYVFQDCKKLTTVIASNLVLNRYMFDGCSSLETFTISSANSEIPECCFARSGLKSITIPSFITRINSNAFFSCNQLEQVVLNEGLQQIDTRAFSQSGVKNITIPSTVINLEDRVFSECKELIAVTINGNSITTIHRGCFEYCRKLSSIALPDSVKTIESQAFYYCYRLKNIILPNGLTSIGSDGFNECCSINNFTIPDSVTYVGSDAFRSGPRNIITNNEEILSVSKPMSVNGYFENGVVYNSISKTEIKSISGDCENLLVPNSVVSLGACAASMATSEEDISNLKTIEFENGSVCTDIGECAFYGCGKLESVELGESVANIKEYAFGYCKKLSTFVFKNLDNLRTIGSYCFCGPGNIKELDLENIFPSSGIESYCFSNSCIGNIKTTNQSMVSWINWYDAPCVNGVVKGDCVYSSETSTEKTLEFVDRNATSVTIDNDILSIGKYAFSHNEVIEQVAIPDSCTRIDMWAFSYCVNLKNVVLGNGVQVIGERAFYNCISLETINFPESLHKLGSSCFAFYGYETDVPESDFNITFDGVNNITSLGGQEFYYNSRLRSFGLSANLRHIGDYTFFNCTNLTTLDIPRNNSISTIGEGAFEGCGITSIDLSTTLGGSLVIKSNAFSKSSIKSINLSDVTVIRANAFYNSKLESITLPNTLIEIGSYAFAGCPLTSIELPESIESIGEFAFGVYKHGYDFKVPTIKSITFSEGCPRLTEWNTKMFRDLVKIKEIVLPDSCQTFIGETPDSRQGEFLSMVGVVNLTIPHECSCSLPYGESYSPFRFVFNVNYNGSDANAPWGAMMKNRSLCTEL